MAVIDGKVIAIGDHDKTGPVFEGITICLLQNVETVSRKIPVTLHLGHEDHIPILMQADVDSPLSVLDILKPLVPEPRIEVFNQGLMSTFSMGSVSLEKFHLSD